MSIAFEPVRLGDLTLNNRIVMAPMTRSRAGEGNAPTDLTATYYAQRASAGLIISEAVQPSAGGQGYISTPGLHSDAQVEAWRVVTEKVHAEGGAIVAQLMHSGRIGHPDLLPDGLVPVAPSPVKADATTFTAEGPKDSVVPRELTTAEVEQTIADFAAAARNAIAAGFDGVELHGANGYLIHQFLSDNVNLRTDRFGGSIEGRTRFAAEVTAAVADSIGPRRLGLRISPAHPLVGLTEADPEALYADLVARLPRELAYLHVMETGRRDLTRLVREAWNGPLILNPHAEFPSAAGPDSLDVLGEGLADAVAFGSLFLANPDLPRRLREGGPFNEADRATFYGGDHRGYTDYPALDGA
ncbi:alkene reductase [Nocardiopsis sediminis]|uniref:Alkene reductase n=1 Tax=Nocardiopsis sediminis TaxID=1778267 RepID=A0ABV8FMW5_9ACTN